MVMSAFRRTVTAHGVTHSIGSPLPATIATAPDGVDETAICSVHPRVADAQPGSRPATASSPNRRTHMDCPPLPYRGTIPQLGRAGNHQRIPRAERCTTSSRRIRCALCTPGGDAYLGAEPMSVPPPIWKNRLEKLEQREG